MNHRSHPTGTYQVFSPKTKTNIFIKDVTFLQKSYGDFSKVEKPVLVTRSYEGLDDEEKLEMIPVINQNSYSYYNVISNSKSKRHDEVMLFDKDFDVDIEINPKTTVNAKVVCGMKKLQALYNHDAKNNVKEVAQEQVPMKR